MMNGITILNETTKWSYDGTDLGFGIVFGIFALICLLMTIGAFMDSQLEIGILATALTTACVVASFVLIHGYATKESHKEYQVTINNSVKMNDFNKKYEIIEQDGKIFTITKK